MSFENKSISEIETEIIRQKRERDAKGPKHPDYGPAGVMIRSLESSLEKKRSQLANSKYWFGYRLKDGGATLACGPYNSVEKAEAVRQTEKAADVETVPWFVADSKERAEKIAIWKFGNGPHPDHEKAE